MHHSMRFKLARTAAFGGIMVLGLGSAQAAMAEPAQGPNVACSTPALQDALASATSGEVLVLDPVCTYWLTSALPNITTDLTIIGDGATLRRVSTAPSFTILSVTSDVNVTIKTLSFVNGGGPENDLGGAIYSNNGANITINGDVFKDNFAFDAGGAIFNGDGTLTVKAANFFDNTSAAGGAILNVGTATVTGGKFLGNRAVADDDNDPIGGAILNDGSLQVDLATFSGNSAQDVGGALFNGEAATVSLTNDFLSANSAGYGGGGIFNFEGTVNVTTSRITDNTAGNTGGGILNDGGTVNLDGNFIHANEPNNCTPTIAGCTD